MNPRVSVAMTVYNGERFLAEAIDSILNQSFGDFELIVIDDGSTDSSGEIAEAYRTRDSRLYVYHQENRGLVESLNRACTLARGEYIARMDADDVAIRDRLARQIDFMDKHPEIAVLGGAVEVIGSAGEKFQICRNPVTTEEVTSALLRGDCPLWHPTVLMRRDVCAAVGGYRKALVGAEDHDLWLRIADRHRLANLYEVVLKYRLHPAQVTVRKSRQHALSALAAEAAASFRKAGRPDPLESITEITPQLLAGLGVSEAKLYATLATRYLRSLDTMCDSGQYSAALEILRDMSLAGAWKYVDKYAQKRTAADLHLVAARAFYEARMYSVGLFHATQALVTRPATAGRLIRASLRRFLS